MLTEEDLLTKHAWLEMTHVLRVLNLEMDARDGRNIAPQEGRSEAPSRNCLRHCGYPRWSCMVSVILVLPELPGNSLRSSRLLATLSFPTLDICPG